MSLRWLISQRFGRSGKRRSGASFGAVVESVWVTIRLLGIGRVDVRLSTSARVPNPDEKEFW